MVDNSIFSVLDLAIAQAGHAVPIVIIPWASLMIISLASWAALLIYLWNINPDNLLWIGIIYVLVIVAELLFSQRRLLLKTS